MEFMNVIHNGIKNWIHNSKLRNQFISDEFVNVNYNVNYSMIND
jgi:hypothetical protein